MFTDPVFWLACYGALLSTILAMVTLLQYRQDRAQCSLQLGLERTQDVTDRSLHLSALLLTITNAGRRPLTLVEVGTYDKETKRPIFPAPFGQGLTLTESQSRQQRLAVEHLLPAAQIIGVYVKDSAGQIYRVKRSGRNSVRQIATEYPWAR
jgi:hypothetical protein